MIDKDDLMNALPEKFAYVREGLLKYGNLEEGGPFERFVRTLDAGQIKEIEGLYHEMERRNDAAALSEWIADQAPAQWRKYNDWKNKWGEADDRGYPTPPRPSPSPLASEIFELFRRLGELGIEPFASGKIEYCPPEKYDWTKLPAGLAYLAKPAEKWGKYQFYQQLDDLAVKMTDEEFKEIQDLTQRMRSSGDWDLAIGWSSDHDYIEHPESARIHFMIELLAEFVPEKGRGLRERMVQADADEKALDELGFRGE